MALDALHRPKLRLWQALSITVLAVTALITPAAVAKSDGEVMTTRDVTSLLFLATADSPPDLSGLTLVNLDLSGLDFKRAKLVGADLFGSDLTATNLSHVNLQNARLDRATITKADFSHADLTNATIRRPNIYASFSAALEQRPTFSSATMTGVNISGHLEMVDFRGAHLAGAVFGAENPDEEVLITPRLRMYGCDFTGAILTGAQLSYNDLTYAKFVNADVSGAKFIGADLSNADFTGANIAGADFAGAKLGGARFANAKGRDRAKNLTIGQ